MADVYALALSLVLISAAVMIHFHALRGLSRAQDQWAVSGRLKILLVIFGLIAAHILEAAVFAAGYALGEHGLSLGTFVGTPVMSASQLFYFSIEAFTTQGVGDVYPIGPLRLIASLEPLAGLILIGWSGSFTFLAMGLDWRLSPRTKAPAAATPPPPPPSTPRS
ncbi:MAG: Kef-type transport system NAD-binding component-related rane protein [Caulobacter sp.]|nr:Kef-type transport system NAD-binding component-related rane protein [Caulobacter sp.]